MGMIALFLFIPFFAHAYLDLGSGSYLLQMLLALAFAIPLSIKAFWQKILSVCKRSEKKEENNDGIKTHS